MPAPDLDLQVLVSCLRFLVARLEPLPVVQSRQAGIHAAESRE